jgi:dihydroorotate dehydrogenase
MFSILRPYIFNLDPEAAHNLAIKALKFNFLPESYFKVKNENLLQTKIFGTSLKNPIGLAAGFDKSAEVYNSLFKFGFGFIEVGTITPKRQFGNSKPRVFRLEKDKALINRLGFNNDGLDAVKERIAKNRPNGFLGINIGPNKDSKNKVEDYLICLSKIYDQAEYITINISSPNTQGLRDLHEKKLFINLMESIEKIKKKKNITKPILVKISPDLNDENIADLVELIIRFKVEGIIISNTTDKNRQSLMDSKKNEIGGLSGKPLTEISTNIIKKFYKKLDGKAKIIGVGGIDSGQDVYEKIIAGANLVQLYTGMVYKGPNIVKEIKEELVEILTKEKIKNIDEIIGIKA